MCGPTVKTTYPRQYLCKSLFLRDTGTRIRFGRNAHFAAPEPNHTFASQAIRFICHPGVRISTVRHWKFVKIIQRGG